MPFWKPEIPWPSLDSSLSYYAYSVLLSRVPNLMFKAQRWDLDAMEHRKRLLRLDEFRRDVLSDASAASDEQAHGDYDREYSRGRSSTDSKGNGGGAGSSDLLLEMSPEDGLRCSQVVKRRRRAAVEALKGADIALRNLEEWRASVLAERESVTEFLRGVDNVLAFAPFKLCDPDAKDEGQPGNAERAPNVALEAEVVINDPRVLRDECAENNDSQQGAGDLRMEQAGSRSGTDGVPHSRAVSLINGARTTRRGSGFRGRRDEYEDDEGVSEPIGFWKAVEALEPCAGALETVIGTAGSEDHLEGALNMLREHVRATLIDLMDLETSIPADSGGDGGSDDDDDDGDGGNELASGGDADALKSCNDLGDASAAQDLALSSNDAGALDVKVSALLRRLGGSSDDSTQGGRDEGKSSHPPSLEDLYTNGLGGAAAASETNVDATERLTAAALEGVREATSGPFLWALDDAYQVGGETDTLLGKQMRSFTSVECFRLASSNPARTLPDVETEEHTTLVRESPWERSSGIARLNIAHLAPSIAKLGLDRSCLHPLYLVRCSCFSSLVCCSD